MRKFNKWVLITSILILIFLFAGSYGLLNSARFSQMCLPTILNVYLKGAKISELKIERQDFYFPFFFRFENVAFRLKKKDNSYNVQCRELTIERKILPNKAKAMHVSLDDLNVTSQDLNVQEAQVRGVMNFKNGQWQAIEGEINATEITFLEYKFSETHTPFISDHKSLVFPEISALFYGGAVKGKISLEYNSFIPYSIKINFLDVNLKNMEDRNDAFSYFQARVGGDVAINGDVKQIKTLKGVVSAPSGGALKASLLRLLVQYIPQANIFTQLQELDRLVERNGYVDVEKVEVQFENVSEETIASKVNFLSRDEVILDANLTFDFNVDGGIPDIITTIKWLNQILPKN